jgi:chemotaxis protein histidine kinase CheA/ActR/RegA family two-component response regulator
MSLATEQWDAFVARGVRDTAALEAGFADIGLAAMGTPAANARLVALADVAFDLGMQALLLGAEDLGRLALTCERCMDLLAQGVVLIEIGCPLLASSLRTLAQAFESLARADRSGARVEPLPLRAARYELETLFPVPGKPAAGMRAVAPDVPLSSLVRRPGRGPGAATGAMGGAATGAATGATGEAATGAATGAMAGATAGAAASRPLRSLVPDRAAEPAPPASPATLPAPVSPAATAQPWVPQVDEDMLELFFDEVDQRLDDLAMKLLDMEQKPDAPEIVRDVFRDLHTIKGSAAMVGLEPMHRLAHGAEDLVGHLRDGQRRVDGAVIDALLAALDALRDIAAMARQRQVLDTDFGPVLDRLREPHAAAGAPDAAGEEAASASPDAGQAPATGAAARSVDARPTIRVDFDKLDRLMNLVGELVLGRDGLRGALQGLGAVSNELSAGYRSAARSGDTPGAMTRLRGELSRIDRVLGDISLDLEGATDRLDAASAALREQVMKLRMVPVRGVLRKHHRTVRDLATALGKRARLELSGEDTELDKVLVESLDEPLMHLVRNAVDHGIEPPDERVRAGKPAEGVIHIGAAHQGNQVLIRVQDDGRGLDPARLRQRARERDLLPQAELDALDDRQVLALIFRPGFSTATRVSAVSGRGVGMDVVRQTIVTELKGAIDIESEPGRGTAFLLRLPLTLAIIQVLLARAGGEIFAIPLDSVVRTVASTPDRVRQVQDREVLSVQGRPVPLVRLDQVLGLEPDLYADPGQRAVVLTDVRGERFGLVCDHLLGKKEIVIKSLGPLLANVPCAAGATLLGERCVLILDVPAVVERAAHGPAARPHPAPRSTPAEPEAGQGAHILLAEDSDAVRATLRQMLLDAGYRVTAVRDGAEALEAALRERYDLVSTDVTMPRMDGYELTRALRARPEYEDTPILMITSRGERIDRVRGFDAGVDEYITKPHDRTLLVAAVRKLLAGRTSD